MSALVGLVGFVIAAVLYGLMLDMLLETDAPDMSDLAGVE